MSDSNTETDMTTCNVCKIIVSSETKCITCSNCDMKFHYLCSDLDINSLIIFIKSPRKYYCKSCTEQKYKDYEELYANIMESFASERLLIAEKTVQNDLQNNEIRADENNGDPITLDDDGENETDTAASSTKKSEKKEETTKKKKVCRYYRMNKCNRDPCTFDHPKLCPKFTANGKAGCPKRNRDCNNGFHKNVCKNAWDTNACYDANCPQFHPTSTVRKPPPRHKNPNSTTNRKGKLASNAPGKNDGKRQKKKNVQANDERKKQQTKFKKPLFQNLGFDSSDSALNGNPNHFLLSTMMGQIMGQMMSQMISLWNAQ